MFQSPAAFMAQVAILLPAFLISLSFHEFFHALTAYWCGDDTAKRQGRLTINPMAHVDFFGLLCLLLFRIGWAKPVPYNPNNLSNRKWGTVAVASAGVLANFFIAILFGLILRFSQGMNVPAGFQFIVSSIVNSLHDNNI